MEFETFHQAYPHLLRWLIVEPAYRNAPRGFASREQFGVRFRVRDAGQRLPLIPARRINIVFNFAEALWYLSGRDDLDFIGYYAPSMRRYSADGVRLTGVANGPAIFGGPGPSQWDTAAAQLTADPDTRRAVLQIFRGEELHDPDNVDVSCTLGLQFMVRSGALHAVAYMRANDVYRGMSCDVFSFTMLQEMMARQLGVRLGSYAHLAGSLHLYDPDLERAVEVLADRAAVRPPYRRMPAMPDGDNWPHVREVLVWEERLRRNQRPLAADTGLPEYWEQVLLLFEVHRRLRYEERLDGELMARLWPLYRELVELRWPSGAPAGANG
ncbi:thymidylate synthase [Nonomuraea sp. NBC_01738]|uniref:thymidylate synthase n=1 Tax=Nonomuraea sp. NBC_01738 TaxID=2976003 RepID=UPI002E10B2E1|nr:thymidylate synthase [Nonomuraea sp. NBC_01738]